jgi:hypothetical protein
MSSDQSFELKWVRVGVGTGILAVVSYSLLVAVPLPLPAALVLASGFGPLLGVASIGLYHFLKLHRRTVTAQIAAAFNLVAGFAATSMLLVQLAVRQFVRTELDTASQGAAETIRVAWKVVDQVQLGLDVCFDVYIALGTVLFALNLLGHPRVGWALGGLGLLTGVLVLVLNLLSFPTPPAQAGSIDVGPLVGFWYLVVCVEILRSLNRLKGQ